jgi:hypothetical protein
VAAAAQGLAAVPAASRLNLAGLGPEDPAASVCRNGAVCLPLPALWPLPERPAGLLPSAGNLGPGRSEHPVRPGDHGLERVTLQAHPGGW